MIIKKMDGVNFKNQYEYLTGSHCTPIKHMEEMVHTTFVYTPTEDSLIRQHC
jgi:hypothetical protein